MCPVVRVGNFLTVGKGTLDFMATECAKRIWGHIPEPSFDEFHSDITAMLEGRIEEILLKEESKALSIDYNKKNSILFRQYIP